MFPGLPIKSAFSLFLMLFFFKALKCFKNLKHTPINGGYLFFLKPFLTFCHYKMLQADTVYFLLQSLKHRHTTHRDIHTRGENDM